MRWHWLERNLFQPVRDVLPRVACSTLIAASLVLAGCGDDTHQGDCLSALPRGALNECNMQYNPRFDSVYQNTLRNRCGSSAAACHTASGMAGDLVLSGDADLAYEALTTPTHGAPLVIPGDPECSPLMARLESERANVQMPPGTPLSAEQRCAIVQWIANGAER